MSSPVEMKAYVAAETARLLGRFVFEANRAARSHDPETIHDLRVSIRRLSQALRVFRQVFPSGEARRVRSRLKKILALAALVRDRDIALELAGAARVGARSALRRRLGEERDEAQKQLIEYLKRWNRAGHSSRWRSRLELTSK